MQAIETLIPTDATTCTTDTEQSSPETLVLDQPTAEVDTLDSASGELLNNGSPSEKCADTGDQVDADLTTIRTDESTVADPLLVGGADETVLETQDVGKPNGHVIDDGFVDVAPLEPRLPDPSTVSARLRNLVVSVGQVEELSRRAREAAADDLALYSGIATSQRQFEDGLAEARRIGQEAQGVYQRAFGREAKAVAEPAVTEAHEVEQAFVVLADAWRNQADTFLAEHPDVEALLVERRQQDDEARRREVAHTRAERFQQLVTATDAALRQGLLDDAKDCLKLLGREFPTEAARVAPLQERFENRVRAANDAAARRVLLQASECQGRGEFDAAVRLIEAVEVQSLTRETSEDVFGRWSAACSLLGQTGDLELLRYSPSQGRGIILHRDPSVPYGLVVFSSIGMGSAYFEGRVISAADREGSVIVARAKPFRSAELPPELNSTSWYGRSYVTSGTAGVPVRH